MDRILVRFPSAEVKQEAMRGADLPRIPGHPPPRFLFSQPNVLATAANDALRSRLTFLGGEVFENVRFRILPGRYGPDDEDDRYEDDWDDQAGGSRGGHGWMKAPVPDLADAYTLKDVIEAVRAPEAWARTRGRGVTIAIVDSGIAGQAQHIPAARRSEIDLPTAFEGKHWVDLLGHGTMCAAIAAGSTDGGSGYNGVAPEATVIAAKTELGSTDIAEIYDELLRARSEHRLTGPLVVSNSYGIESCKGSSLLPPNHPFMTQILAALDQGVFVCFAAGNYHSDLLCNHDPTACGPNTIWGPNSHDRVVSVGTVNRDLSNCDPSTPHVNSSRGPGQWASTTTKPDCVAPTYGEVPWGTTYRRWRWWGTSGACPQVAGAAALVLSVAPHLDPAAVAQVVTDTCSSLPEGRTCVGHGLIDCASAVEMAGRAAVST